MKLRKLDELNEVQLRRGVSHKVFSGDNATLAWGMLQPGHETNPHSHPHEQLVYIVQGRVRFTVGDESAVVEAGDMLVVPSGVEHWAENLGSEEAIDLSIFSPRRDDYAAEETPDGELPAHAHR
jgi:quercetin dioxygenase-like cupin family protein